MKSAKTLFSPPENRGTIEGELTWKRGIAMKEKVLALLKQSEDYLSGEEMSGMLGVSRSAVWKAVRQLQEMGYTIESKTKRGYRLVAAPDILFEPEFADALHTSRIGVKIRHLQAVSSTNDLARQYAEEGGEEGYVVLSENQLHGRGRGGGSWLSAISRGIYLSAVLRPQGPLARAAAVSLLVSCAVRDTLEEITALPFETRWPGDICCAGRKVCGILIESAGELERLDYCVAGIGINVNFDQEDFEQGAVGSATSLKLLTSHWCDRKQLVPALLNRLDQYYCAYLVNEFPLVASYQRNCLTVGKRVLVNGVAATCSGFSSRGEFIARLEDGTERTYWPGEVGEDG